MNDHLQILNSMDCFENNDFTANVSDQGPLKKVSKKLKP